MSLTAQERALALPQHEAMAATFGLSEFVDAGYDQLAARLEQDFPATPRREARS